MISGENFPPNQRIYQGHGYNNVVLPHVRIDPGTNSSRAYKQGCYVNPYQEQVIPQDRKKPKPKKQPQNPTLVNTNNKPLIDPREAARLARKQRSLIGYFFFIGVLEIILYVIVMADHTIWFQYCLYNFSLFKIQNFGSGFNNNFEDISSFYNTYCNDNDSFEIDCPGFCDSISNLRYSQNYMLGFGIVSMICIGLSGGLLIWKHCKPSGKLIRRVIYLFSLLTVLFLFIGFIAYIASSKFNSHFKSPDAIHRFSWAEGFFVSICLMVLMGFNFLILFYSLNKVYNRQFLS